MESYAPVIGMIMVSVGSLIILAGLGGLLYVNWPRSKRLGKPNPANAEAAGPAGESS